jgi:hypothetical protein
MPDHDGDDRSNVESRFAGNDLDPAQIEVRPVFERGACACECRRTIPDDNDLFVEATGGGPVRRNPDRSVRQR